LIDSDHLKAVQHLLARLLEDVRTKDDDVANWPKFVPLAFFVQGWLLTGRQTSPFKGVATSTFQDPSSDNLEMVDGGSNGEVIPIGPLLVKARGMDVVIAVDGGADDDDNWPT
jgi:lysophospholipase